MLKTLNEISPLNKDELKKNAIKWVKYLESRKPIEKDKTHWAYCNEQQKWIKHFFNIQENGQDTSKSH